MQAISRVATKRLALVFSWRGATPDEMLLLLLPLPLLPPPPPLLLLPPPPPVALGHCREEPPQLHDVKTQYRYRLLQLLQRQPFSFFQGKNTGPLQLG
jgi:hypothetical protein